MLTHDSKQVFKYYKVVKIVLQFTKCNLHIFLGFSTDVRFWFFSGYINFHLIQKITLTNTIFCQLWINKILFISIIRLGYFRCIYPLSLLKYYADKLLLTFSGWTWMLQESSWTMEQKGSKNWCGYLLIHIVCIVWYDRGSGSGGQYSFSLRVSLCTT